MASRWWGFWTKRREAAARSFLRVLAATTLASYFELGKAPLDLTWSDGRALGNAALAAALLTTYNALRSGETRFGRGSDEPAETAGQEP